MVYKTSPPPSNSCAGGSDQTVDSMQDLLNFINGDGPTQPQFRRHIVGEQRRHMMQSASNGDMSGERMDDEELGQADDHGDVDFEWVPPNQR